MFFHRTLEMKQPYVRQFRTLRAKVATERFQQIAQIDSSTV